MEKIRLLYPTPPEFDDLMIESDGFYLTGLKFVTPSLKKESSGSLINSNLEEDTPQVLKDTCKWLDAYFSGKRQEFTINCQLEGLTPFRKEVIDLLCKVPYGDTVTYGALADCISARQHGRRMSAQAVGGAVGWNPIVIIIPCHRVVGANKKLTGYGGGLNNKKALLRLEGVRF